jgi:hypothetical protein
MRLRAVHIRGGEPIQGETSLSGFQVLPGHWVDIERAAPPWLEAKRKLLQAALVQRNGGVPNPEIRPLCFDDFC